MAKHKSAACSTGHDTGVIQRKTTSWPPPKMLRARPGYKDAVIRSLIGGNRKYKQHTAALAEKLKVSEKMRMDAAERARKAEERLEQRGAAGLLTKMAQSVKRFFSRKTAMPMVVYRNKT